MLNHNIPLFLHFFLVLLIVFKLKYLNNEIFFRAYGEIPVNAVVSVSLSKIFDDGRMNLTFKKVLLKPSVPVKQDAAVEKRKRTSSKSEEDAAAQKIKVENVLRSEDMETIEVSRGSTICTVVYSIFQNLTCTIVFVSI